MTSPTSPTILWFENLSMQDIAFVGGKNASLGEMYTQLAPLGVKVPNGFATTTAAYGQFLTQSGLQDRIYTVLDNLNIEDVSALAKTAGDIRQWIIETEFLPEFKVEVTLAWEKLVKEAGAGKDVAVAVRSSATAEDLPDASFAGQQETFLNVRGIDDVLISIKQVFASLFTDRAIAYRAHHNFDHREIMLSAGIQHMVRSDLASSGVMFTLDTESGFDKVVFVTASYGLGEMVVQGAVNPDEFYVYKPNIEAELPAILRKYRGSKFIKMIYNEPGQTEYVKTVDVSKEEQNTFCINDTDINILAKHALQIEKHYQRPMDIEWAKDGMSSEIYIVQARPETVKSREKQQIIERYLLQEKGNVLTGGRSIGQRIGQGTARVLNNLNEMDKVQQGDVLVTDMTDPNWEPIMKRASAIVTNRGGRTCHAAIIARELGIPAVVGCGDATKKIANDEKITVSCAEGDTGYVYEGELAFEKQTINVDKLPELPVKIMMNIGNPDRAFAFQSIPNEGVGLARIEFIINNTIGVHPQALLDFDNLPQDIKTDITEKIFAYESPVEFYIEKLREGISTLAAAFYPKPVIVRLSDFKSNEYANLLGGTLFEPKEENPMIGFRGASRYLAENFKACFALECEAIKRVRDEMGLTNVEIMIPFVRTVSEAEGIIHILKENGLVRGKNDLRIIMMCEVPSNAILADDFLEFFDGFSIGSNDLTQLTLGLDRDSGLVANQFDERNKAVKKLLHEAIQACKRQGKYIGICGQGPSDHADFAVWLMEEGIESLSLNPDTVIETTLALAKS